MTDENDSKQDRLDASVAADDEGRAKRPRSRRRKRRALLWGVFVIFDLALVLGIALLLAGALMAGRDLPAPDWVADEAGRILSQGLGGGQVEVGQVTVQLAHRRLPEVAFRDVRVAAPSGAELVTVPSLGVSLDKSALFSRKIQPKALHLDGAAVRLLRKTDGTLDLGFGRDVAPAKLGSVEEAIAAVQRVFALPGMEPIHRIEVTGLDVHFDDRRAGRLWRVEDGRLVIAQDADALSASVDLKLPSAAAEEAPAAAEADTANGAGSAAEPETAAKVALRLSLGKTGSRAEFSALVDGVAAADIAAQNPAVAWLRPLDARVSGAIIAGLSETGEMETLNGTLEIGPGAFQPERAARPIHFDGARAYFGYRPEEARLSFEQLQVHAPDGTVSASGHAYLEGLDSGWPTALVGQFRFSELRLDPPGLLPGPATFDEGILDLKVEIDPFVARIGQLVLTTTDPDGGETAADSRLHASGRITADGQGWHVALDMGLDEIGVAPMMALWPLPLVPRTRDWIERNLLDGQVFDASAGVRFDQGQRPDVALTFEFRDAKLRPMQSLPPIQDAAGYGYVGRDTFSLSLDAGRIQPPEGGEIDVAGSVFTIDDMATAPRIGEILWHSTSSTTAALSLLDQPPFRFLQRAGKPVNLADGHARLDGRIAFPMRRRISADEVEFDVAGALTNVVSEEVVPGRRLGAEMLDLQARPDGLRISGAGTLDEVPLEAAFSLPLGAAAADHQPSVEGAIDIGETFVSTFGIGLPEGSVTGAGPANFRLDLPKGAPPVFALTSALEGVGLSIPSLGWSKAVDGTGELQVSGYLGDTPAVTALRFAAAGLAAEGRIDMSPDGGLGAARFDRVQLGEWLDAPVTLIGRGTGNAPVISIVGGRVDLRRRSGASGSGGSAADPPVTLALDRLQIDDDLFIAPFRGDVPPGSGVSGTFAGNLNGQAPVSVALSKGQHGKSAIRVTSQDAGAVFRSAGILEQAAGGSMTLTLQPRAEDGEYDGQLKVENLRVRGVTGLVSLANAISVVGLLDELNGSGIVFSDVEAAFRLTPRYLQVTRSSGVGPSLGITMEGIFDMGTGRLDMQGVFSPIYMVNSIGSIFTRKGEGLFGVTYRMRGPASDPSVDVNPLSMLTPGMFREIFRAAPPQPRARSDGQAGSEG
ncbi:AsmA-like C-terminal region-containing protein [Tropicimonas marinistellae]|uniref:AsmA-like C-terminal region-containing protein n=1 Tax=Tropicimonas marinistellae TaxID=1739787 RepID=UPI00082A119C|nr:AsmA-like C-terminal region-containing protein [Tropicimonas marinistellae]